MLVDVHAHLEHSKFESDLDDVIIRAKEAGVVSVISAGTNHQTNKETLALAEKYDIVNASLGIYPLDALNMSEKEFQEALSFIEQNKDKIVAMGEIGLDYYHIMGKNEEQKRKFLKLIELAKELKLPVIVHSRKAELDVVELLETAKNLKIIMHCFSGSLNLVKRAEKNGWYFSIPTNVLYSSHFQKIVETVSLSRILTETDSPFLSPMKGKRNEPANIVHTIDKIAKIKNIEETEIKKIIFMNYQKIFH